MDTMRAATSASNLFRRALCPGSERLEEGLPDEDSPESREGTLLHEYDANPQLDRSVLTPDQRDLLRISEALDNFVFARCVHEYGLDGTQDAHFVDYREVEL